MNKIALIATSLSIATLGSVAAFAAGPMPFTSSPTSVDQVLATPEAQRDPLTAMTNAGYVPGSEEYEAVLNTLNEHIPATSPYFTKDVDTQIATVSTVDEQSLTE